MKKYIFCIIIIFMVTKNEIKSQAKTPIQLDRPDQTECPFIVPTNYIQMENGFTFEQTNSTSKSFSFPLTLWKYGLNEKFEFRLITEPVWMQENDISRIGINPITLGFKTNICQEKGIIPTTSFIGHITTSNWGSKEFNTSYIAPSFRFTMQHTISKKVSLAYNLGAEWNGETPEQRYIYTLTTGIQITEKLGSYIEVYGFAPSGSKPDHRFDGGFTYLINNDFIVDLSGGLGITDNAPRNYISLGISYRFKLNKK